MLKEYENETTDASSDAKLAKKPNGNPAFIHSALDDYGLANGPFRVFCHVVRRAGGLKGSFFEKLENTATAIDMDKGTVRDHLKLLRKQGLISRTESPGCVKGPCFRVNPISEWLPPLRKNHTPMENRQGGKTIGDPYGKTASGVRTTNIKEGDPKKEIQGSVVLASMESAAEALRYLNGKAGRNFREVSEHLKPIASRIEDVGGDLDGIKKMIDRQCAQWKSDARMAEHLRPRTLFGGNFHSYYDDRDQPFLTLDNPKAAAPVHLRIKLLQEQIDTHPANWDFIRHNPDCSQADKDDLKNTRRKLADLKREQAGEI